MTERIAVGDLVQVIRGPFCCNNQSRIGYIFTAQAIRYEVTGHCKRCGAIYTSDDVINPGTGNGIDIRRLKRIPPLSELEGKRTEENLKEPA